MTEFITFAVLGLAIGAIYGLLAQGVVLMYQGSGVVNFAQGAFAMVGAYVFWELQHAREWPWVLAALAAVVITAALGFISYSLVIRPLQKRARLVRMIATLGMLIILQSAATLRYESQILIVQPSPIPHGRVTVGAVSVAADRLIIIGVAVLVTLALTLAAKRTRFGLATVAGAENPMIVATAGWSPSFLAAMTWTVGGGLAGIAGILISTVAGVQPTSMTPILIGALAAALLAGFRSYNLTLLGAFLVGVVQSEVGRYVSVSGLSDAMPMVIIVGILLVAGRGLPMRSFIGDHLPAVGNGRLRLKSSIVGAVVLGLGINLVFNDSWVNAVLVSLILAVIILSVVVVTGYAGQISLAQYALAGVGALISGQLVAHGWSFLPALLIGVVGTIPVGVIFALPALRTRGINLAIVTLGLGLALQAVVFNNSDYTGGLNGTTVGGQHIFGIDIDPILHTPRYTVFVLVLLVLTSIAVVNLRRGRAGGRLLAVRAKERAAASLGISVVEAKLYAFALSSAIAALGGILLAFANYAIIYTKFDPLQSINAVLLGVVGGVGYVLGPVFGSTIANGGVGTQISTEIFGLNFNQQWLTLAGGVILILLLLQDPNGVASVNAHIARAVSGRVASLLRPWLKSFTPERRRRVQRQVADVNQIVPVRVGPSVLRVQDLSVVFGGVVAVRSASFEVESGEIVGLIGPNGAGKTTVIDLITGFVKPATGQILLGAKDISRLSAHGRARQGVTRSFQSLELFDDLTVLENLRAACDSHDRAAYLTNLVWPRVRPLSPAAEAAVVEFGLQDDLHTQTGLLSYGRRRLVAIARAVAAGPSILLLDEPAAGLSDLETSELGSLVRRLSRDWGIGILLVEHDLSMVMGICDRVVVLEFGEVIASGTPVEIRNDRQVLAAYLGVTVG